MTRDRALDGHINRALEGKTVTAVSKDGTFMTIHCTNGEHWRIAWADFVKGEGYRGEPAIVSAGDMRLASGQAAPADGSVHACLKGRTIESTRTDGQVLSVRCTDGRRYGIAWVDPATKLQIRAEPCLVKVDAKIRAEGVSVFGEARM